MKKLLLLLPLLFVTGVKAQDALPDLRVQNSGGTIVNLHDVKLIRVEPDGLRVIHQAGMAKVPYELLPADLQAKYGFTDAKAHEHRDAATAAAAPQSAATATPYVASSATQAHAAAGSTLSRSVPRSSTSSVTRLVPSTGISTSPCGTCVPYTPVQSSITSGLWGTRPTSTSTGTTGYIYPN
jgi:hypothetical protein